jgi:hypothetical protein
MRSGCQFVVQKGECRTFDRQREGPFPARNVDADTLEISTTAFGNGLPFLTRHLATSPKAVANSTHTWKWITLAEAKRASGCSAATECAGLLATAYVDIAAGLEQCDPADMLMSLMEVVSEMHKGSSGQPICAGTMEAIRSILSRCFALQTRCGRLGRRLQRRQPRARTLHDQLRRRLSMRRRERDQGAGAMHGSQMPGPAWGHCGGH